MDRVKGKVAIVTGGAGVLGKAQALLLAKEGAKVVVTDIAEAGGKEVVEAIEREGGFAIFLKHDVSNEEDWKKVIDQTRLPVRETRCSRQQRGRCHEQGDRRDVAF